MWSRDALVAVLVASATITSVARAQAPTATATTTTTATIAPPLVPMNEPLVDAPAGIHWDPSWHRFRWIEGVATLALAGGILGVLQIHPVDRHWPTNALDDGVRDALRLHSLGARLTAAKISEVLYVTLTVAPIVTDTIVATVRKPDVGLQVFLIDAESMSLSGFTSIFLEQAGGQARPLVRNCGDPDNFDECGPADDVNRWKSFPSGHTMAGFTGAGMLCVTHTHLALYGNKLADYGVCGLATAMAMTEATMRVMADRHYATDVAIGGVLGFGSGYGLPLLLHYGGVGAKNPTTMVLPYAAPNTAGLQALGVW